MSTKIIFEELAETVQGELKKAIRGIDPQEVDRFLQKLVDANQIFIAGKGRTGLQMQSFAMRLMHLGLRVHVVGDVTTPGIQQGDLLVISSASGKTPPLVGYAETAVKVGVRVISITSNHENPIADLSEVKLIIPAPSHKNEQGIKTEKSILPLGGLFELALGLLLNIFVLQLMEKLGIEESEMVTRHANLE